MSDLEQKVIRRIGGLLEVTESAPPREFYLLAIELNDNSIWAISSKDTIRLESWPDDADKIPTEFIDSSRQLEGSTITNVIVRESRENEPLGGKQLFMVLNGSKLAGVVPAQRGTFLLVEPLLTSPSLRRSDKIVLVNGQEVTIDELVL